MLYYTVYKVTNKIDGKFYIGIHKTLNLDDGYMGSGKYLKRAQEKYGIENFEKEILFVFDNPEEMFAKEAEIVNEDFLALENTYNLKVGGFGGWGYINSNVALRVSKNRKAMKACQAKIASYSKRDIERIKSAMRSRGISNLKAAHASGKIRYDTFTGKSHSDKTKKIISEKAKERLKDPTKNSQYGTMWIHSLEEKRSKKILKTEPIPEGWIKGRKLKFK